YRAAQVWEWVARGARGYGEMTNLPAPLRERLEAAVEHDDPAEARRLVAQVPFNEGQRRNVEQLLDAWERTLPTRGR
ncbi:MAG TPA: hypothetical protein VJR24_00950, partial [Gemmatimonadaceae bacterium]|nr:hypothetical protein [Gemmatimonadaceae bacterium]